MVTTRNALMMIVVSAGLWSSDAFGDNPKPLTGPEITAALSGNTVKGSNFSEYYDPNGSVRGTEGGSKYKGSWKIASDKLCVDFQSYNYKQCITIRQKDAERYEFIDSKGTNTNTIVKGNPGNL